MPFCMAVVFVVLCLVGVPRAAPAQPIEREEVTRVDLVSSHRLPESLVRSAIGNLSGYPVSRSAIRESLDRLWSLGHFSAIRVDAVREPGGIRLRFHLARRPYVQSVAWTGESGLPTAILASAAALSVGGDASPERLERTQGDLLVEYRKGGFFGARVAVQTRADPETNGREVTFDLRAGEQAKIGDIRIRGLAQFPAPELMKALGLHAGDRYDEAAARAAVGAAEERMHAEGYFEARLTAAPPLWDRAANRVTLDLSVVEGPLYRVEFTGNLKVKDSDLRDALTFLVAGVVDDPEIRSSVGRLEAVYRERGYAFARVSGTLDRTGDTPVLRFQIHEGTLVTVESIEFSGNRAVSARELLANMETRPAGLLQRGLFRQDLLDRDALVLLALYRSKGFPEATVGPAEVQFMDGERRARIRIPVVEGPKLTVGGIGVEGAIALSTQEILKSLPIAPGDPWNPARVDEVPRVIQRLYVRHGYLGATVALDTTLRDGTMLLTVRIQEGGRTRVGRILVSGLVLTQEQVVSREMPFRPGDPFDPDALLEAERRLTRLRLFERVEVGPLQPPPAPFTDVLVTLREGKPWRLDLGLGYGTDEGARAFLEVGHDNLLGTGRSAGVQEKVDQRGDRTDLVYREPWLLGSRWQGEARLSREKRSDIGFEFERAGGAAAIQRDLFPDRIRGLAGVLRYRLDRVTRFQVDPALAAADVVPGTTVVASVTPALTLDRRDHPLNPTRGSLYFLSVEAGGWPVGSDINFLKSRLEASWFLDWPPPTVLALSARLGLATPLGDTPDLAIEDRFFAGGSGTIRGYREKRVGPREASGNPRGGDARVLLNLEWRIPIWRWVGAALFLDTGAVTPAVSDLAAAAFKTGVGVGLRLNTPVGPLRLDFGYALNRIADERRWQIYFSVGNPF